MSLTLLPEQVTIDAPRTRGETRRRHAKHTPARPKHDQHRKQRRIDRAIKVSREVKRGACMAFVDENAPENAPVMTAALVLVPPLLTQQHNKAPTASSIRRLACAMEATRTYSRTDVLLSVLLCLRRVRGMNRDVMRYICMFVDHERMVVLGGAWLHDLPDAQRSRYIVAAMEHNCHYAQIDYERKVYTPCRSVLSVDVLGKRWRNLAPLPFALWKLSTAWRAASRELWVCGVRMPDEAYELDHNAVERRVMQACDRVLLVFDERRNAWRQLDVPFALPAHAAMVFHGNDELLFVGGALVDVLVLIGSDGSLKARNLPPRMDMEALTKHKVVLFGDMVVCVSAASQCKRMFADNECPCCDTGRRGKPQNCCSSIQMLDLTRLNKGWISLPVPKAHFAEPGQDIDHCAVFHSGSLLMLAGVGSDAVDGIWSIDVRRLQTEPWQFEPRRDFLRDVNPYVYDGTAGHPAIQPVAASRGFPSLCALVPTNLRQVRESEWGYPSEQAAVPPVQLGVWINGATRWTLPEYASEQGIRLFSATAMIN